jgi:hypothetical protein
MINVIWMLFVSQIQAQEGLCCLRLGIGNDFNGIAEMSWMSAKARCWENSDMIWLSGFHFKYLIALVNGAAL